MSVIGLASTPHLEGHQDTPHFSHGTRAQNILRDTVEFQRSPLNRTQWVPRCFHGVPRSSLETKHVNDFKFSIYPGPPVEHRGSPHEAPWKCFLWFFKISH